VLTVLLHADLRIDSSLPLRKRRRLSSPTYDEQLELPSKDELKVIDQLELSLSQAPSHYRKGTSSVPLFGVPSEPQDGSEVRAAYG
jgi:hypothetical protein